MCLWLADLLTDMPALSLFLRILALAVYAKVGNLMGQQDNATNMYSAINLICNQFLT